MILLYTAVVSLLLGSAMLASTELLAGFGSIYYLISQAGRPVVGLIFVIGGILTLIGGALPFSARCEWMRSLFFAPLAMMFHIMFAYALIESYAGHQGTLIELVFIAPLAIGFTTAIVFGSPSWPIKLTLQYWLPSSQPQAVVSSQ